MTRAWLRWMACTVACGWAVVILAAPWLASSGERALGVSSAAYLVGSIVCHQRPERSFHLAGAQLPVCARCAALYLGGACGLLLGLVLPVLGFREPASLAARRATWRWVLASAAVPMALAVVLEWTGAWAVPNTWRAALSLPAAWAAGALVAESLSFRVTL